MYSVLCKRMARAYENRLQVVVSRTNQRRGSTRASDRISNGVRRSRAYIISTVHSTFTTSVHKCIHGDVYELSYSNAWGPVPCIKREREGENLFGQGSDTRALQCRRLFDLFLNSPPFATFFPRDAAEPACKRGSAEGSSVSLAK